MKLKCELCAQGLPASCRDVFQLRCTCGLSDWTACGGPGWIPCKPWYRKTAAASQVFSQAGLFPGKCEPHAVLAWGEESGLHGVCCCCWARFQQGGAAGSCNSHTGSWRSRSLFLIHHQGVDVNPEVVRAKSHRQNSERVKFHWWGMDLLWLGLSGGRCLVLENLYKT